jgi:hypothetical protein
MRRQNAVAILFSALLLSSCSQPSAPSPDDAPQRSSTGSSQAQPPVSEGSKPYDAGGPTEPSDKYSDAATPTKTDKCTFEERDPSLRPPSFLPASHSSNIIFYQGRGGPLWSDIDPDRAIAELRKADLIVAARFQMPDLWIRALTDGVTLEAGKYRLTCY